MCRQDKKAHMHTPPVKRTNSELPEDLFVSILLIFLWSFWESAGILRVVFVLKLIWRQCKWRYCWFVYFVWNSPQRFWVLHAQVCFSLTLRPIHYITAIWPQWSVSLWTIDGFVVILSLDLCCICNLLLTYMAMQLLKNHTALINYRKKGKILFVPRCISAATLFQTQENLINYRYCHGTVFYRHFYCISRGSLSVCFSILL